MVPTKLSLQYARNFLRPHLKDLPFTKFQDYLGGFTRIYKQRLLEFQWWPSRIYSPIEMDLGDMVLQIPIREGIHLKREKIDKFEIDHLLLLRCRGGEMSLWRLQRSTFGNVHGTTNVLYLKQSMISDLGEMNSLVTVLPEVPNDFPQKFWAHLGSWVRVSIERRRATISALEKIAEECKDEELKFALSPPSGSP